MEKSVNSAEKRKERLNVSILAQFESDTSEASKDIQGILQSFVDGKGGGEVALPPPYKRL